MVISVTYRPNLCDKLSKKFIQRQCDKLSKYHKSISMIKVTFVPLSCKKKSPNKVRCHISIHLAQKRYINIYANNTNSGTAFLDAVDSARKQLSQLNPNTMQQKRKILKFMRCAELNYQAA